MAFSAIEVQVGFPSAGDRLDRGLIDGDPESAHYPTDEDDPR